MEKEIAITISSGRGPAECERAVLLLAERLGKILPSRIASETPGQRSDGRSSIVLLAEDSSGAAISVLAPYLGTVLWVCPSPYRAGCKRKNWFIRVSIRAADESSGQGDESPRPARRLDPSEIRFETARSSGKGGQHVNKTETAVRVVHLPTGLSAVARDERSQLRNKEKALSRLEAILAAREAQAASERKSAARKDHRNLERGNAAAVFEGPEFRKRRRNAGEER
jgi:peptide chain release factor